MLLVSVVCCINAMPCDRAFICAVMLQHLGGAKKVLASFQNLPHPCLDSWHSASVATRKTYGTVLGFFLFPLWLRSLMGSIVELWIVLNILTNISRQIKLKAVLYITLALGKKKSLLSLLFIQSGKYSYTFILGFLITRYYCFENNDTITTVSNIIIIVHIIWHFLEPRSCS